jgi:hypothetical protein
MDSQELILKRIEDLESRVAALEGNREQEVEVGDNSQKKQSIKEFVISKKPSNDVQNTLVFGYFLEKSENMTSFNTEDIDRCFRLAKIPVPSNLNDKINMNIRKGHLMEADEKKNNMKAWMLTLTGEQFIEGGLNKK